MIFSRKKAIKLKHTGTCSVGGWRLRLASSCAASPLSLGAASAGGSTGVITGVGIAGASLEIGVDSEPVVSL